MILLDELSNSSATRSWVYIYQESLPCNGNHSGLSLSSHGGMKCMRSGSQRHGCISVGKAGWGGEKVEKLLWVEIESHVFSLSINFLIVLLINCPIKMMFLLLTN